MKLATVFSPAQLREIFATPRSREAPHETRELKGSPIACAGCGKSKGQMIAVYSGRRRWTDATGRHSEKLTERRHPECRGRKPTPVAQRREQPVPTGQVAGSSPAGGSTP